MNTRQLQVVAWGISGLVSALAVVAWGGLYKWHLGGLTAYQFFPLLGLLAFSLMWAHYVMSVLRRLSGIGKDALKDYFRWTSYAVLVALLLHPGILIYARWHDGFGLPPASYLGYVSHSLELFLLFGTASWLAFMAYELHRKFDKRPWWPVVEHANSLAILLIFFHGLKLGSHLSGGWFRAVWMFYGVILIGCLGYIYAKIWLQKNRDKV